MKKGITFAVAIIFGMFMFIGCAIDGEKEGTVQSTVTSEPTLMVETTQIPSPMPVQTPGAPQEFTYDDPAQIIVRYHNEETQQEEESTYEIGEDAGNFSALDAVNAVIFGEDKVKANSIVLSEGNLFIDFDNSIYDIYMESSGEGNVLEAIADAYLNNVEEVNAIYYSVNGEDYSSGHIIQGKDQPFKLR